MIGIGGALADGTIHDGRAPDYDDWVTPTTNGCKGLNGDIVLWYPLLNRAFEISSMGIRVNADTLQQQLQIRGALARRQFGWHKRLLAGELPLSIGGGIGQSRLCMFFLRKLHIGEVQASVWPQGDHRSLPGGGDHAAVAHSAATAGPSGKEEGDDVLSSPFVCRHVVRYAGLRFIPVDYSPVSTTAGSTVFASLTLASTGGCLICSIVAFSVSAWLCVFFCTWLICSWSRAWVWRSWAIASIIACTSWATLASNC